MENEPPKDPPKPKPINTFKEYFALGAVVLLLLGYCYGVTIGVAAAEKIHTSCKTTDEINSQPPAEKPALGQDSKETCTKKVANDILQSAGWSSNLDTIFTPIQTFLLTVVAAGFGVKLGNGNTRAILAKISTHPITENKIKLYEFAFMAVCIVWAIGSLYMTYWYTEKSNLSEVDKFLPFLGEVGPTFLGLLIGISTAFIQTGTKNTIAILKRLWP